MVDAITDLITPSTEQVQSASNFVLWLVAGLVVLCIVGYLIYMFFTRMQYNYHVTIHRKVGEIAIKEEDKARKIADNQGNYFFHYLKANKKSPTVKDHYLKIVKRSSFFGLLKKSMLGFDAWLQDGKIIPMDTNIAYKYVWSDNPGWHLEMAQVSLTGIDYDSFNFLQSQIMANIKKYQRIDKLMQMLPYIGLFIIVMGFIIGMIFYSRHIENVAQTILGFSKEVAQSSIENSKLVDVIQGK